MVSFQAISATGAKPIACDINHSCNVDWRDAERRLTVNTKAIMPVHYSGGVMALMKFTILQNVMDYEQLKMLLMRL